MSTLTEGQALVDVGLLAELRGRIDVDLVAAVGALRDLLRRPDRFGVERLGRLVLGQRRIPGLRVLEIVRELGEVGIEPLVEQLADDADQHGIVEASGDSDMKRAVMDHRGFAGMLHGGHRLSEASMRAMSSGVATRAACSAMAPSMNSRARNSSNGPSISAAAGKGCASAAGSLT